MIYFSHKTNNGAEISWKYTFNNYVNLCTCFEGRERKAVMESERERIEDFVHQRSCLQVAYLEGVCMFYIVPLKYAFF